LFGTLQIILVSRIAVVAYGVFMGVLAIILQEIGLNLGWVYLFMGIVIGSAVFPIYCCLTWTKTSAFAAIAGAGTGQIAALICWLVTCASLYDGKINVDNLGQNYPMLAGSSQVCWSFIEIFHNVDDVLLPRAHRFSLCAWAWYDNLSLGAER
jgi:Na+/proline symporter